MSLSKEAWLNKAVHSYRSSFAPPAKLTLSEWADRHAVLSAESSAESGRWTTLPYQKGIMDLITDPNIERISVKKSARVGYTKILNNVIGYYIHQDPCSIMLVQPTVEDAEGYSKEEIAPMLRDTPALNGVVTDAKQRDGTNSILHKLFPGGQLSLVGANSPRGFRRVSRRVVLFDETSAYPRSSGKEGSPIKLGIKRTEYFWNRKIVDGSTPGVDHECAITKAFEEGDKRFRFLPCPKCGHMQYLKFHNLRWPKGEPEKAHFVCEENECIIKHDKFRWMDARGEWRATAKPRNKRHASLHIWAAYSYSPNTTWADIAREFDDCKDDVELLKTFVNTVLGEAWVEKGEAPDYQRLYERRELYPQNVLPKETVILTAGADVQKDRIEVEVVAWGRDKQSWSVDYLVFMGDTAGEEVWKNLDNLLNKSWRKSENNKDFQIRMMSVDSGYNTQHVYNWVRKHPADRVRAVDGRDKLNTIVGTPKDVDLNRQGTKLRNALKIWPVGVSLAKSELYSWLKLDKPEDGKEYPKGYCHFPQYDLEHFKRLCSESLMKRTVRGRPVYVWENHYGRNEQLDCRVYARAAAAMFGLDRFSENDFDILEGKFDSPEKREIETELEDDGDDSSPPKNDFWSRQRDKKKLF